MLSDLKAFAIDTNQTSSAMKYLLQKLSKYFPSLPLDPRTLLDSKKIPQNVKPSVLPPGHYHHFGIENGLKSITHLCEIQQNAIKSSLIIDGLPPFRNSMNVFLAYYSSPY